MENQTQTQDAVKKKPFYKKWWFIALVAVFVIGVIVSTTTDESEQPALVEQPTVADEIGENAQITEEADEDAQTTNETAAQEAEQGDSVFAVGDTIRTGDFEITVVGYSFSDGADFFTPDSGNVFYLIDVAIVNTGSRTESISSLLMFDLRDADGFSISTSFGAMAVSRTGLDGAVLPGRVIRGELGFEVPRDSTGFVLQINPQVFGRTGLFAVNMDTVSSSPRDPSTLLSTTTGNEFAVGQTIEAGDLSFIVNGTRTVADVPFFEPDPGNTFLLVDVTVENNGAAAEIISSMLMFTLRDAQGFSFGLSMGAMAESRGSLDGDVMAGSNLRGELGFEVPIGAIGLELIISPSVFRTDDIVSVTLNPS